MVLTVKLGATVQALLEGHSMLNGAVIPENGRIEFTSNDPNVARIVTLADVPVGGAQSLVFPVQVLGVGSTDIHVTVTTADGVFEDTATLIVEPTPIPGLARVTLTLKEV